MQAGVGGDRYSERESKKSEIAGTAGLFPDSTDGPENEANQNADHQAGSDWKIDGAIAALAAPKEITRKAAQREVQLAGKKYSQAGNGDQSAKND